MNATRRGFIRGALAGLGLMMVPAVAILRPKENPYLAGDYRELLDSPDFNLQAMIERDMAEGFAREDAKYFIRDGGYLVTNEEADKIHSALVKGGVLLRPPRGWRK